MFIERHSHYDVEAYSFPMFNVNVPFERSFRTVMATATTVAVVVASTAVVYVYINVARKGSQNNARNVDMVSGSIVSIRN